MQQSTPYLSFRGIGKTFPGVKALTDISFLTAMPVRFMR